MCKAVYVTLLAFLFSFIQLQAQYKIEVQVKPLVDVDIFLGYHYGNEQFVIDTCHLDEVGRGVFSGKKSLHEGVYMIVLPNMNYFDILISDVQKFSIVNDTLDLTKNLLITGSEQNQIYVKYQNFVGSKRKEIKLLSDLAGKNSRAAINKTSKDSTIYYKQRINDLENQITIERDRIIKTYPKTFFVRLLTAMADPKVPDEFDAYYDNEVLMERMNYLANHYFDYYDFSDESLLYSPVLYKKLHNFFADMVLLEPDSLNLTIDNILMRSMKTPNVYRYIADQMMNLFDVSGDLTNDEAFVYLAENYYLNDLAPWTNQLFLAKLKNHINSLAPTLVGKKAPILNLKTVDNEEISLQSQASCYTLVVFWNPDCDYCLEYIQQLTQIKKDFSKEFFDVYSVFAGEKPEVWKSFVQTNVLDWVNVYDPSGKNEFVETYNLYTTPRIFLLDKNKKIVRKDIAVDLLLMYLEIQNKNHCK